MVESEVQYAPSRRCNSCGYNLAGLRLEDGSGTCPECGDPFRICSIDPTLLRDLRCAQCGYGLGLGGLTIEGEAIRCPECGEWHSLSRMRLVTPWPSGLRIGVHLAGPTFMVACLCLCAAALELESLGIGLTFLLLALAIVVPMISGAVLIDRHQPRLGQWRPLLLLLLGGWVINAIVLGLLLAAVWRIGSAVG